MMCCDPFIENGCWLDNFDFEFGVVVSLLLADGKVHLTSLVSLWLVDGLQNWLKLVDGL